MTVAVDTGYAQYSGNFIPEIWSGKLQVKFYASSVLGEITNNDWEGEIKNMGDKVHIRTIPTITVRDYKKGMNLTNEVPESTPIELNIDHGKYFSVVVDDVDDVQSDIKMMDTFTGDASEQMKRTIDTDVLTNAPVSAAAENKGATAGIISGSYNLGATGSPVQLNKTNILDFLVDLGTVLDEQNVPETGRFVVIPAWAAGMIKKSDLKDAAITGDSQSVLRNGRLGMIDRFTLYSSNNLPGVTDGSSKCFNILAGTKDAISFASQITKVETLRAQSTFGNIVRGLNIYGYGVTKPEALAVGYVYR